MKKIYLSIVLAMCVLSSMAQIEFKGKVLHSKGKPTVCPADFTDANTYVPPPAEYYAYLKNRNLRVGAAKSTFKVTYRGFSPAAQAAFQKAVDIWASILSSPIPIYIDATYRRIPRSDASSVILGQAGPGDYTTNFNGSQRAFTWYPIALAEKMAQAPLNTDGEPDIFAEFNSDVNWYFDKGDAVVPQGQFDFVAIVLHELCHGLGFTSTYRANTTQAAWGDLSNSGATYPRIYDYLIVNGKDESLLNTTLFANPSTLLRSQLTSNNLFFNSPLATAINNNTKPKVYAPTTYEGGSSISHLDDATYRSGDRNSLMTSAASQREIIRDPGPITLNILAQMGGKGTSLLHTPKADIEDKTKPVVFSATIKSDTTLRTDKIKLFYTENDTLMTRAKSVDMKRVGTSDVFEATIPAATNDRIIRYYMTADDASGRTYTNPPDAPRYIWRFDIQDDKIPPDIEYYPPLVSASKDTVTVITAVTDNLEAGINSVVVEYSVNGVNKTPITLGRFQQTELFFLRNTFGKLNAGDVVKYRIVATDNAKGKNRATLPLDGSFYDLVITDFKPLTAAVAKYKNDFNGASAANDFVGNGFSITQPEGFNNPAIHSIHPYKDGVGYQNESNWVMNLLTPIIIDDDSTTMRFDEVVLVEPGEKDSEFGAADFYDYVVVEGSLDGRSWAPFETGWDSRDHSEWTTRFNSNLVNSPFATAQFPVKDSRATGNSTLYKKREINLLTNDFFEFQPGDKVYIRFRLFADQITSAWGWAIDNLEIQTPPPPPVTSTEDVEELVEGVNVSPNPTTDELHVKTVLQQPGKVIMEFYNIRGIKVKEKEFTSPTRNFNQTVDLRDMKNGYYLVKILTDSKILTRKIMVER
jgi:hypothetical protein